MNVIKVNDSVFPEVKSLGWSSELTTVIFSNAEIKEFSKGDVLCRENEYEKFVGLLLEGELFVQFGLGAAKIRINAVNIFGEIAYILPRARSANVIASKSGIYLHMHFFTLRRLFNTNSNLAAEWYRWLSSRLAERMVEKIQDQDQRKYIALIAHDNKKQELVEFVKKHQALLQHFYLTATNTTARKLLELADVAVTRQVASGPLGGDQAVGQLITTGNIKAVIFFRDPLNTHPHEVDVQALMRLCDVYSIPLATNSSSANLLLKALERTFP